ncbi:4-alpha-glucanotransferase [Allocoprobacillus halotolerans]|uniref:4-alpha-glucanotransferase n=1 Tax=Allocoprobacillus halotolerans TaxID=2944914 RepID=A0ABY5I1L2_9FIRM|nr:4-alpha-glucanotransferase [Allocoprobacillus halotolerans]UTY38598.1 4-alpha-glucanotransferase [Allocoprobacillus halotolerans]
MKKTGILFPISALPSAYGVGDFGKNAYQFIDKIAQARIKIWQILPLNPLGYGNSPYQPLSSHAGDELYLDLDTFIQNGLLKEEEVKKKYHKIYMLTTQKSENKNKNTIN